MNADDLRLGLAVSGSQPIVFHFEGAAFRAFAGESIAAALLAVGVKRLRSSPRQREARGLFCGIGVCQECVVLVDGRTVTACMVSVKEGMQVFSKRYAE